jgi:hypothetical protein
MRDIVSSVPRTNPMAYELHIQSPDHDDDDAATHVTTEAFAEAVGTIADCRLATGMDTLAVNPATGEKIRIEDPHPRAEVLFPGRKGWLRSTPAEWIAVFWYREGDISFKAAFDLDDPEDPVRVIAAELARKLGCRIVGDDGEEYSW